MTVEETRNLSNNTVSELLEIIRQLSEVIERQEQELQYWRCNYEEKCNQCPSLSGNLMRR